jgi:hypothetical protein
MIKSFLFFVEISKFFENSMALAGHISLQSPQKVHIPRLITIFFFSLSAFMQLLGQFFSHNPQPMHFSLRKNMHSPEQFIPFFQTLLRIIDCERLSEKIKQRFY